MFSIETYKESREHYQYTIHHASNPINKLEEQQEDSLFNELFTRHSQMLARQVGDFFFPMPSPNNLLVYFFCEIVSACCFEYETLYVKYLLDLPDGWRCDTQNLSGVTQSCKVNDVSSFYISVNYALSDNDFIYSILTFVLDFNLKKKFVFKYLFESRRRSVFLGRNSPFLFSF